MPLVATRVVRLVRRSIVIEMRKPNFFIIGAPKCGTTSLAAWLKGHPRVFMPEIKEPDFFNTDDRQRISSLSAYEKLFNQASCHHEAVGEASVWYLSSSKAVTNVLQYQPDALFIVLVRNPIEMAPALHSEMVFSGHEDVRDFRAAWDLQGERRQGRRLPAFSWAQRRFQYGEVCKLGNQLERLFMAVPERRILTVIQDDVIINPRKEYLRVLKFLGIYDDGREHFPVLNTAKSVRWPFLTRAMFAVVQMKRRAGITVGVNLWNRVSGLNKIESPRAPPTPETLGLLRDYFAVDVELLGELLGRNLGHWLEPN